MQDNKAWDIVKMQRGVGLSTCLGVQLAYHIIMNHNIHEDARPASCHLSILH